MISEGIFSQPLNLEQKVHFLEDNITKIFRSKHEKLEGKGEASFDTPFMIQNHTERKSLEPFRIYQLTSTANLAKIE